VVPVCLLSDVQVICIGVRTCYLAEATATPSSFPSLKWVCPMLDRRFSYCIQRFLATVCKTVRPMLSDRCPVLSCPVCLSLTYVCSGQTVAWIKMKHDMQDASRPLSTPHCVRWGPSSPPKRDTAPNFRSTSVVTKRLDGSRCHLVGR